MSHKISCDIISISALCICLTVFHPLTLWHPFRSTDSLLVPTFLSTQSTYILALWEVSFHLHYPNIPLKHHDYEEDIPTSSQQMADDTAVIYDSMYPHGITACIYPIQLWCRQHFVAIWPLLWLWNVLITKTLIDVTL